MAPGEMRAWLAERPRVLDGACGSELLRNGVTAAAYLWGVGALLDATDAVRNLHRDYAAAGAEALTAATFRVAPYALRGAGLEARAGELAALAVRLAREGTRAAGRNALVFASQTTLEDCYRPDLVPDDATLAREHAATAGLLAAAKPDALLLETFNTVREARIAADAATGTGLPVVVSLACQEGGRLLSDEDARDAAAAVAVPGVVAVGVNCTAARELMAALVRVAEGTDLPLVAYANNAWSSSDSPWLAADPLTPLLYARYALAWAAAGARLVGGCCGTAPAHIAAVASTLQS
ncbi:MAG: homocysteine S-methyltransferase family protein [Acidobacteriia bacterium]|nr:homocysteine S-methyltransferase family protein [Terriglobia bacterium]